MCQYTPGRLVSSVIGLYFLGVCLFGAVACSGPRHFFSGRGEPTRSGRPPGRGFWQEKIYQPVSADSGPEKEYPPIRAAIPTIPKAEYVKDDELCMACHESYVQYHKTNIHRDQSCEECHGPGSQHVRTRGQEPGLILSFKKMKPAERSETCLKCHEQKSCSAGKWRTSAHANGGVSCTDCHKSHYNVPAGTPATKVGAIDEAPKQIQLAVAQKPKMDKEAIRAESRAMGALNPQTCYKCHDRQSQVQHVSFAHQMGGAKDRTCQTCHEPHGNIRKETRTTLCLECHKGHSPGSWQTSAHAHHGVTCTDCHNVHPTPDRANLRALGAAEPQTCYKCHKKQADLHGLAHPHQIGGPNNHTCQTCHEPHGNIKKETRTDMCLQCHKGHPTMAWQSSAHALNGVACADCHTPHPGSGLPAAPIVQHFKIDRPKRLPMAVQDPETCYPCHQNIFSQFLLPSHHPLQEGKMRCGSCHDAHGNHLGGLKEPTVNLVCYKCHAEKQGPFVYEHPPVSENCDICHNPHGTVADNLLRQPAPFLCLRCHSGHRGNKHTNIDLNRGLRPAFYTDCTQCHAQIHGTDQPSQTRRGARLTR